MIGRSRIVLVGAGALAAGLLAGTMLPRDAPLTFETASAPTGQSTTSEPSSAQTSTTTEVAADSAEGTSTSIATEPVVINVVDPLARSDRIEPLTLATRMAPLVDLPSDCGTPMDEPESLPNATRDYRSGVHQGIDFICEETGRLARAAADGRVVFLQNNYLEPTPDDRNALLGIAASLDRTPPWTLSMLFGNVVVIDHGLLPEIGHVVTVSAHLDSVDPSLRTGSAVRLGDRIGTIGNTGTATAASGGDRLRSLHLHWEIYVDDLYLGAGLGSAETRQVYEALLASD